MFDHVFIDVETTGIDADSDEIIDIAAIRTNRKGDVLAGFSSKVKPVRVEVSEGAKAANRYSEVEWREANTLEVALGSLSSVVLDARFEEKYIVVAHFAEFDRQILKCERKRLGKDELFKGRAWVCTGGLAWPLVANGMIGSRSLDSVAKHFGIVNENPHTAMGDVTTTMQVYWQLMRRYKTLLRAEEMVRDVGGDKLEAIRKFIGI